MNQSPTALKEHQADVLLRADREPAAGTRICVAGRGRGTYVRFERKRFGANEHTIRFEDGRKTETARVQLKGNLWTVQEKKMDEVAREPLVRRRGGRGCCGSRPNDDGRRPSEDGRRPSEGTPPSLPSQAAADGPIMIDGHDYAEIIDEMEEADLSQFHLPLDI